MDLTGLRHGLQTSNLEPTKCSRLLSNKFKQHNYANPKSTEIQFKGQLWTLSTEMVVVLDVIVDLASSMPRISELRAICIRRRIMSEVRSAPRRMDNADYIAD